MWSLVIRLLKITPQSPKKELIGEAVKCGHDFNHRTLADRGLWSDCGVIMLSCM
jgi:hypothetical protein